MVMNIPKKASQFLSSIGWDNAKIEALAGDASFRRYFRIKSGDKYAMLMDAPPPHEDPKPFINVAQYLTETGFRAPIIYGADLNDGLVLIEDFGDIRMREYLDDNPDDEDDTQDRTEHRQDDIPKELPWPGSIHLGRFQGAG